MIYDGRIIWSGPTAEMRDSGDPYVDQFVNSRADGPIPTVVDPTEPQAESASAA